MDKTIEIVELFRKWEMAPQEQAEMYHDFLNERGLLEEFYEEMQKAADSGMWV